LVAERALESARFRRGSHTMNGRDSPRVAVQELRDRNQVAIAADVQRLATRGGDADRPQREVYILKAIIRPSDQAE